MTNPKFKVASSTHEETKCPSRSKERVSDLLHLYASQMGDMRNVKHLPQVRVKQLSHAFQILVNVIKTITEKAALHLLNKCQENMSA